MAWPPDKADGDIILAAHINAIKNSVQMWQGYVDANGFDLTNLASITGVAGKVTFHSDIWSGDRIYVRNDSGQTQNTLRLDGYADTLYIMGSSAAGAPAGTRIVLGTAAAGTGDGAPVIVIEPTKDVAFQGGVVMAALPGTYPGAGTKKLWYDPADGNRVKLAV